MSIIPNIRAAIYILRSVILPVSAVMLSVAKVHAACPLALQSMSVSAGAQKCGYTECRPSTPPKYFLISTYTASANISAAYYNDQGSYIAANQTGSYTESDVSTEDPLACTNSTVYSGTASYNSYSTFELPVSYSGTMNASTGTWSDNGDAKSACLGIGGLNLTETTICTSTKSGSITSGSYLNAPPISEVQWGSLSESSETGLSKEYTDDRLRQTMIGKLPPYPADYITNWSSGSGAAFYSLDANHFSCGGGKMKYKFYICSAASMAKGQSYTMKWKQITTYPGTTTSTTTKMSEGITANGDPNGMYSSVHEVDVPGSPSTIVETDPILETSSSSPPGQ